MFVILCKVHCLLYFDAGVVALREAAFGVGLGPIVLDNVECDGSETELQLCPHNGVGNHNCRHFEDAGVKCNGKTMRGGLGIN